MQTIKYSGLENICYAYNNILYWQINIYGYPIPDKWLLQTNGGTMIRKNEQLNIDLLLDTIITIW